MEWTEFFFIANGLLFFLVVFLAFLRKKFRLPESKKRHIQNISNANVLLDRIRGLNDPRHIFFELRRATPYEVEELVLSAFEIYGAKVIRNRSYVGDGGIDGRIVYQGNTYVIQTKKYENHINNKDVLEFRHKMKRYSGGFFVHTGKTGALSWKNRGDVKIISGQFLVNFLNGTIDSKVLFQ